LIPNLVPNTVYYVLVTASNSKGEGYKNQKPSMIRTMPESFANPSSLYVWGSNSHSEIGLSEDLVNANIKYYQKSKDKACLIKGIKHDNFDKIVQQVACGNISTTVLCNQNNETFIVQMGSASVLQEKYEDEDINIIYKDDLHMMEDIKSVPFGVEFFIPVVKVTCGDVFAGLLTAEGQVFTWGHN